MAILTKRSSSASLPGTPPRVARPSDKMTVAKKAAQRPSAILTSAMKPNAKATTKGSSTATPSMGAGAPTSMTTEVSGATHPSITRNASASSSSNMANTLKNALLSAGAGVASKMAYDKIFGTNTAAGGKDTTVSDAAHKLISALTNAITLNTTAPNGEIKPNDLLVDRRPTVTPAEPSGATVTDADGNILSSTDATNIATNDTTTGEEMERGDYKGGLVALMADGGGVRHFSGGGEVVQTEIFDDGSYIEYLSDGSSVTYDSDSNVYQSARGGDGGNQTITYDDGSTITFDASGNVVSYTNAPDDSGNKTYTYDDGSTITYDSQGNVVGTTEATDTAITGAGGKGGQGALASLSNWFKDNPNLGAGAAGALIGALLSNKNLFGGSNEPAPSIDMSKVGVINPRTTGFGIGAPKFVTYNEYSARDQMPDLYGDKLYRNLNAPGFNPVREGDYGYEAPAEESADVAQPKMADGGSMDTYFTFGKPVDPLQNIMNPTPAQMPVQSQMGQTTGQRVTQPHTMKRGGLHAVSDVPLAGGRLDFRQSSAVHGPGDGQSDDIPAMLADGEYVIDAEIVAQIGNGSTKAGAKALDEFRENIRRHKRSAPENKIPPKTKALTSYLKKGK